MGAHTEILDYAHHITERSSRGRSQGERFSKGRPFFPLPHWCVFCGHEARKCYGANDHKFFDSRTHNEVKTDEAAYECNCGWWSVSQSYGQMSCGNNFKQTEVVIRGILRRFDCTSLSLPLDVLRRALLDKGELLNAIHPRKMEELVKSVFEDFFHCEVEHCGRSGDGGVDLALVLSDRPLIVQVKRRRDQSAVESVSAVRELLGAAVVRNVQQVIFVTSADHFSRQSTDEAQIALLRGAVSRFELIDRHRFLASLHLIQDARSKPWWNHLLTTEMEKRRQASMQDVADFVCDCGAVIHSKQSLTGYSVQCTVCRKPTVLRNRVS